MLIHKKIDLLEIHCIGEKKFYEADGISVPFSFVQGSTPETTYIFIWNQDELKRKIVLKNTPFD